MTSQMYYLRGNNNLARDYARASVLSQSILNQLVPKVNQKIIQMQQNIGLGGNITFNPPKMDLWTAARLYLTNRYKQPKQILVQQ